MSEQWTRAKKEFSRIGFALLALGLVTTVLQILFSFIFALSAGAGGEAMPQWMLWVMTFVPLYLAGVPVCLLIMRSVQPMPQPAVKLMAGEFWKLMLMCMPVMYGGNILGNVLSALLSGGTAENALLDYISGNPLFSLAVAVILAPVIEEYIFRKQIIDRLGKYGEKTAIVLSALTFGLFHMNLFQFFYAFGLGLIFAYVYTRTYMLRYPVIMHMIINFMGSFIAPALLSMLNPDAMAAIESGQADMALLSQVLPALMLYLGYFLLLIASVIAGTVLLIRYRKKWKLLPAPIELPGEIRKKTAWGNLGMVLFTLFCIIMILFSLLSGLL